MPKICVFFELLVLKKYKHKECQHHGDLCVTRHCSWIDLISPSTWLQINSVRETMWIIVNFLIFFIPELKVLNLSWKFQLNYLICNEATIIYYFFVSLCLSRRHYVIFFFRRQRYIDVNNFNLSWLVQINNSTDWWYTSIILFRKMNDVRSTYCRWNKPWPLSLHSKI